MVMEWKDRKGEALLEIWKKRFEGFKEIVDKERRTAEEISLLKEISIVIKREIKDVSSYFELEDIMRTKSADCVGYMQLLYILGNVVGFSMRGIEVARMAYGRLPMGIGHTAVVGVELSNGKMVMIDLTFEPMLFSQPFDLEKEFRRSGEYWEIVDERNPVGLHRRIRILDRKGIIAQILCNRGAVLVESGREISFSKNIDEDLILQGIAQYEKAIQLSPDRVGYYNRGLANEILGKYREAIADYSKAIEYDPLFVEVYARRALLYKKLNQEKEYKQDILTVQRIRLKRIVSELTAFIKEEPDNANLYYERGKAYAGLGDVVKAKKDLIKAVEINPMLTPKVKNISKLFDLDLDLDLIERVKNLEDIFRKAWRHIEKGDDLVQRKEINKAIEEYTKAIEINPEDAYGYLKRGIAYGLLQKHRKAIHDLDKAIQINSNFVEAYYNRGAAYGMLGEHNRAIVDFNKAIEIDDSYVDAYINRGIAYAILGDKERAEKDLRKAFSLCPDSLPMIKKIAGDFDLNVEINSFIEENVEKEKDRGDNNRFRNNLIVQLTNEVKSLGYPEETAQKFAKMVMEWKEDKENLIISLRDALQKEQTKCSQGKISKEELAQKEMSTAFFLGEKIKEVFKNEDKVYELSQIVREKKANCLGYTQIFYVLGNIIGLSLKPVEVAEVISNWHIVNMILSLSNGKEVIVDLTIQGDNFISKPFRLEEEYEKRGIYWEYRKEAPLGIGDLYRKIRILDKNGLIAQIYHNRADEDIHRGKYNKAMEEAQKAIEYDSNDVLGYYNLGVAYIWLENYEKAISQFKKVLNFYSRFIPAYLNLGVAYKKIGVYSEALHYLNKIVEFGYELDKVYFNLAHIYLLKGDMDKAEDYFSKIKDRSLFFEISKVKNAFDNTQKAFIALNAEKYQDALKFATEAVRLDPDNLDAQLIKSVAYRCLNNVEESIKEINKIKIWNFF